MLLWKRAYCETQRDLAMKKSSCYRLCILFKAGGGNNCSSWCGFVMSCGKLCMNSFMVLYKWVEKNGSDKQVFLPRSTQTFQTQIQTELELLIHLIWRFRPHHKKTNNNYFFSLCIIFQIRIEGMFLLNTSASLGLTEMSNQRTSSFPRMCRMVQTKQLFLTFSQRPVNQSWHGIKFIWTHHVSHLE